MGYTVLIFFAGTYFQEFLTLTNIFNLLHYYVILFCKTLLQIYQPGSYGLIRR